MAAREKPADETNVVGRMQIAMGAPTVASLALKIDEHLATVKSWKRRNSAPADVLMRVSKGADCRLEWLQAGPPEPRFAYRSTEIDAASSAGGWEHSPSPRVKDKQDEQSSAYRFDPNFFTKVMEVVEEALSRRRVDLEAARRVRLFRAVYDLSVESGAVNRRAVEALIEVAFGKTGMGEKS